MSFTLFLDDPDSYEGGELVTDTTAGEQSYKLPAGSAVVYPSSTLHRVEPVSQGQRRVAIGWIQSTIRDPAQREVLFDLDTARRQLFEREGKTAEFDLLTKSPGQSPAILGRDLVWEVRYLTHGPITVILRPTFFLTARFIHAQCRRYQPVAPAEIRYPRQQDRFPRHG